MYLAADRLALANREIREAFARTCVAWQSIPHWDTGDPAQTKVRSDVINNPAVPGPISIVPEQIDVQVTLDEAIAPTPDSLLAKIIAHPATLAATVDAAVFPAMRTQATGEVVFPNAIPPTPTPNEILYALIAARAKVESAGFRSPSCVITDTGGIQGICQLVGGTSIRSSVLDAANANSLHRVDKFKNPAKPDDKAVGLFLGRRQRISHGGAAEATPGEEPVDLAVSVPPSLEVVGNTANNMIDLRVRISYATRIKDIGGLVVITGPP
jgi:hypothetical protein